jgi:hypothetical protein
MLTTMHRTIALAIAALWSLPVSAGDLPPASVYVAPGGVYIGSAQALPKADIRPDSRNDTLRNIIGWAAFSRAASALKADVPREEAAA